MSDDDRQESWRTHSPAPPAALLLTFAALFATALVALMLGPEIDIASLGVGQALGVGAVATLAARSVPEPQAERLGLRGFELRLLVPVLALAPIVILTSELDNWIADWFPAGIEVVEKLLEQRRAEQTFYSIVQGAIVTIGISPVVEEWLFRGVIQQGVIAHLGLRGGLAFTTVLFSLGHAVPPIAVASPVSMLLTSAIIGLALGIVRIATGSLLAPILLHAAFNALGFAAITAADGVAIQGFNTHGEHTPLLILAPALLSVILGGSVVLRELKTAVVTLPIPEQPPEDLYGD